jgi:hypothetical protein
MPFWIPDDSYLIVYLSIVTTTLSNATAETGRFKMPARIIHEENKDQGKYGE